MLSRNGRRGLVNKNTLILRKTVVFLFYCFSFLFVWMGRGGAAAVRVAQQG